MRNFYTLFITSLAWLCLSTSANAALMNMAADSFPDIKARNAINYYYTNGTDDSAGFTMNVIGAAMTIQTSSTSGNDPISGSCGTGCYDLVASFDSNGGFLSGTLDVTGTSAGLTSGVYVDATLQRFGFGGEDDAGLFQFSFTLDGGDYKNVFGAADGGTIIDTRDLGFGAGYGGSALTIGDWDLAELMTMEFSTISGSRFNANTTSDTFVPVPAAAWLFGSGLIAMFGVARRKGISA